MNNQITSFPQIRELPKQELPFVTGHAWRNTGLFLLKLGLALAVGVAWVAMRMIARGH